MQEQNQNTPCWMLNSHSSLCEYYSEDEDEGRHSLPLDRCTDIDGDIDTEPPSTLSCPLSIGPDSDAFAATPQTMYPPLTPACCTPPNTPYDEVNDTFMDISEQHSIDHETSRLHSTFKKTLNHYDSKYADSNTSIPTRRELDSLGPTSNLSRTDEQDHDMFDNEAPIKYDYETCLSFLKHFLNDNITVLPKDKQPYSKIKPEDADSEELHSSSERRMSFEQFSENVDPQELKKLFSDVLEQRTLDVRNIVSNNEPQNLTAESEVPDIMTNRKRKRTEEETEEKIQFTAKRRSLTSHQSNTSHHGNDDSKMPSDFTLKDSNLLDQSGVLSHVGDVNDANSPPLAMNTTRTRHRSLPDNRESHNVSASPYLTRVTQSPVINSVAFSANSTSPATTNIIFDYNGNTVRSNSQDTDTNSHPVLEGCPTYHPDPCGTWYDENLSHSTEENLYNVIQAVPEVSMTDACVPIMSAMDANHSDSAAVFMTSAAAESDNARTGYGHSSVQSPCVIQGSLCQNEPETNREHYSHYRDDPQINGSPSWTNKQDLNPAQLYPANPDSTLANRLPELMLPVTSPCIGSQNISQGLINQSLWISDPLCTTESLHTTEYTGVTFTHEPGEDYFTNMDFATNKTTEQASLRQQGDSALTTISDTAITDLKSIDISQVLLQNTSSTTNSSEDLDHNDMTQSTNPFGGYYPQSTTSLAESSMCQDATIAFTTSFADTVICNNDHIIYIGDNQDISSMPGSLSHENGTILEVSLAETSEGDHDVSSAQASGYADFPLCSLDMATPAGSSLNGYTGVDFLDPHSVNQASDFLGTSFHPESGIPSTIVRSNVSQKVEESSISGHDQTAAVGIDHAVQSTTDILLHELPANADPGLIEAKKKYLETGQIAPVVKYELKCAIMSKRHKEGKGDIQVTFEPPRHTEMTEAEKEKESHRKELNRKAAASHRQRKKDKVVKSEKELTQLSQRNTDLKQTITHMETEIASYARILLSQGVITPAYLRTLTCFSSPGGEIAHVTS